MKKTKENFICVCITCLIMLMGFLGGHSTVFAADSTVKIYIGDSTTARHHMAIVQGDTSEEYHFELKGYTAKSSTYRSSNPASFRITETGAGTCRVEAVAEGSGLVTLTIQTTEGKTLTEKVFVSVYKRMDSHQAKSVRTAGVYRGASDNAGVENEDKKGTLAKGQAVTVIATCGEYYLFRTNDGSVYEDNKDTGFVKKNDINILVESVTLQTQNFSLEEGKSTTITAAVSPKLAGNKELSWTSGGGKIASVDSSGQVKGITEGTTTISAAAKDGSGKQAATYISVYKKINEVSGRIKSDTDLYVVANDKIPAGKGNAGQSLTISGTCGDYYRVKMSQGAAGPAQDGFCYVRKNRVVIPVTGITLNTNQITLMTGKKVQLEAVIVPGLADNKNVVWKSSNPKAATVDGKGVVTTKKAGKAVISVVSADGSKSDQCEIIVTEAKYQSKKVERKPIFRAVSDSFDTILLTVESGKKYNGFTLYRNGKKYKDFNFGTGSGVITVTLDGLRVNQLFKLKVRTFLKKKGKKTYSKMSNEQSVTVGKIIINTEIKKNKEITIHWKKIKKAVKYEIYRAGKRGGKYKKIKEVKGSVKTYTDHSVKLNKTYYYKIKPVNSRGVRASSNVDYATACKLKSAARYLSKKYKAVCVDAKKKMNSYQINGVYSPVKYKFAKGTLEIHVYLEFVTYTDTGKKVTNKRRIYKKKKASVKSAVSASKYIAMFQKGIKKAYRISVTGGKGDFKKGINFKTSLIIHEKKAGKKYHAKQKFIEVLIGGECPNCTKKGDHWYHANPNYNVEEYDEYWDQYGHGIQIYMPTHEQVRANTAEGARDPDETEKEYGATAAHELGHALGMNDAYADEKYDRCVDNSETGYKYHPVNEVYDNLMKYCYFYQKINANGIEMMLKAVKVNTGIPDFASQNFASYGENKISPVIRNRNDYQDDKAKGDQK